MGEAQVQGSANSEWRFSSQLTLNEAKQELGLGSSSSLVSALTTRLLLILDWSISLLLPPVLTRNSMLNLKNFPNRSFVEINTFTQTKFWFR